MRAKAGEHVARLRKRCEPQPVAQALRARACDRRTTTADRAATTQRHEGRANYSLGRNTEWRYGVVDKLNLRGTIHSLDQLGPVDLDCEPRRVDECPPRESALHTRTREPLRFRRRR